MTSARVDAPAPAVGCVRPLPLAAAVAIVVGVTVYPQLLADAAGRADHLATLALCWAMSAGFVRGVGFRPQRLVPRALFSGWAVAAGIVIAALRLLS
jgi:predicted membrane protein